MSIKIEEGEYTNLLKNGITFIMNDVVFYDRYIYSNQVGHITHNLRVLCFNKNNQRTSFNLSSLRPCKDNKNKYEFNLCNPSSRLPIESKTGGAFYCLEIIGDKIKITKDEV